MHISLLITIAEGIRRRRSMSLKVYEHPGNKVVILSDIYKMNIEIYISSIKNISFFS